MEGDVPLLTRDQAYVAMFAFLQAHWEQSGSDDIGALLGSLSLLPNGAPVDPALAHDWDTAVGQALAGAADTSFRFTTR